MPSLLGFVSEASLPLMWPTSGIEVGVALGLRELGGCPGPCAARQPATLGGHPSSPGRAHAWLRLLRGLGAAPLPTQAWVLKSYSPSHLGHCQQTPELPDSVSASVTLEGLLGYCASRGGPEPARSTCGRGSVWDVPWSVPIPKPGTAVFPVIRHSLPCKRRD